MSTGNTTMTFKMPKKLKRDFERVAKKLGIPLTTILNALLTQFVRDQTITLSVKPREFSINALRTGYAEMAKDEARKR